MVKAQLILKKVIDKGGMIGESGKTYINDPEKSHKFILELYEHINIGNMKKFWGSELISEIEDYKINSN